MGDSIRERARALMDGKAKPPGALGSLEAWSVQLAILQNTLAPKIATGGLLIFAGSHGVTDEKVSPYPSSVTGAICKCIRNGGAAGSVIARSVGVSVEVHDMGVATGTANMTKEAAMTPEMLEGAMQAGRAAVRGLQERLGDEAALMLGEVGIGNTTAAAALLSAFTGTSPERTCGRGTGLGDEGVAHKARVVGAALELHAAVIEHHREEPKRVLSALGGLEIAAMVGAILQAFEQRMPVLLDGFTVSVAGLVATRIHPPCALSLFLSTQSAELGASLAWTEIAQTVHSITMCGDLGTGGRPVLDMGLRLGEGTGAVLAFPILKAAADVLSHMISLNAALEE
ncbi:unnamed protein product [Chrysoparadoxa australica]